MVNPLINIAKMFWSHPLTKHNPQEALVRFVKWQIAARCITGSVAHQWVNGVTILVSRGETGVTQNVYCGLHEFADMAFILHAIDERDFFADVGSNVGSYTILACAAKGARGICFEPVPQTFGRLQKNLVINDLGARVEALNVAVGAEAGTIKFSSAENCTNHVLQGEELTRNDSIEVEIVRLDDCLRGRCPDIMKMDVEGFETNVLKGGMEIFSNPQLKAVVMELNGSGARYGFDEKWIVDAMKGWGFKICIYDPLFRALHVSEGADENSGNVLFVRDVEAVSARVRESRPFTVLGKSI